MLNEHQVAAIEALILLETREQRTVGISAAVASGDRPPVLFVSGRADAEREIAVDASTVFGIGSVTKTFAAALARELADKSAIRLDVPVAEFLPEFAHGRSITIRQLLDHRSGIIDEYRLRPDLFHAIEFKELLRRVDAQSLQMAPGSCFRYNNLNYLILTGLIERVTSRALEELIVVDLCEPLALHDTFLAGSAESDGRIARGYTGLPSKLRPAVPWHKSWLRGAGGMSSSSPDLARWGLAQGMLQHVDERDPRQRDAWLVEQRYHMGWGYFRQGRHFVMWHDGELSGFRAACVALPHERLAIAVLSNADGLIAPFTTSATSTALSIVAAILDDFHASAAPKPSVMAHAGARFRDVIHRWYFASSGTPGHWGGASSRARLPGPGPVGSLPGPSSRAIDYWSRCPTTSQADPAPGAQPPRRNPN